ncbi:MAG: DUF488 domain-containing protein [Acidobacteria bacterium]|nr:DUF488 domain-containing protein [Acidobacteriota bacterium]MBS1864570.1 DUF488 domain-containing protein [Acidobacteriota bacterium]
MNEPLYTVGHSNRTLEEFLSLLKVHEIQAIADVRSQPYSKMYPQFDREALAASLKAVGIAYVFLGRELGARSQDPSCYEDGKVQFDRLARAAVFKEGLERVHQGMKQFRVALMCAEKEPLACHRTILVARELSLQGVSIRHILSATESEDHAQTTERLLRQLDMSEANLFMDKTELIDDAYRNQAQRIAYERAESAVAAEALE